MFLAMVLKKEIESDQGFKINCVGGGCVGMIPVFETIEAAREIYGDGVATMRIDVDEGATKEKIAAAAAGD